VKKGKPIWNVWKKKFVKASIERINILSAILHGIGRAYKSRLHKKPLNYLPKKKQLINYLGYLVDESSHLKKGDKSVGVSRQYAGVIGKVDNSQVGVYASLVNDKAATIINERIFLPKTWTEDTVRCNEAKIPKEHQVYKTKPALALEMIKQDMARGVDFDWIGGDGCFRCS